MTSSNGTQRTNPSYTGPVGCTRRAMSRTFAQVGLRRLGLTIVEALLLMVLAGAGVLYVAGKGDLKKGGAVMQEAAEQGLEHAGEDARNSGPDDRMIRDAVRAALPGGIPSSWIKGGGPRSPVPWAYLQIDILQKRGRQKGMGLLSGHFDHNSVQVRLTGTASVQGQQRPFEATVDFQLTMVGIGSWSARLD